MSFFSWIMGGSKSAAEARQQQRHDRKHRDRAPPPGAFDLPSARDWADEQRGKRFMDTHRLPPDESGDEARANRFMETHAIGSIDNEPWYDLISSNVDRIRYHKPTRVLQVIFKNGALYQFEDVPPEIFMGYLRAPSPGQYHWYVIRGHGYSYQKLSTGNAVMPKRPPRFDEQPYVIPDDIQDVLTKTGRKAVEGGVWNVGAPTAKGVVPPHDAWQGP